MAAQSTVVAAGSIASLIAVSRRVIRPLHAIRDAIASGTTPGPSGEIKFNEKGQGYGFTVFLTRNENSKPVVEATALIAKPN